MSRYAAHDRDSINSRTEELRRFADRARASDEQGGRTIAAAAGLPSNSPRADFPPPNNSGSQLPVRRRPGGNEQINREIADGLRERHGIEVYGFGTPGVDTDTVRGIVAALEDMLAKYPHTRILSVEIGDVEGDIARALEDRVGGTDLRATRMTFSTKYATDPKRLSTDVSEAVQSGHFVPRSQGPAYSEMVHEFGHALTYAGRSAALDRADSALLDYYRNNYGHKVSEIDMDESYRKWRDQLSSYSFWKGGELHPTEALAEAFADVELNGARASEPAQVLHGLLVDTAESEWRREGLI
ncbi:hypothetical protein IU427_05065 [Nocardia beijingensis]|uniref:hypothetical protein n=1 Tax=Nocardia beijingensis TaxID=95162 RepID=UPI001893F3B7|nr:hypothetical protein [Nocardia beijingensis]MBF6464551.1 hypothetical protein [Nocardia beijingensis]